MAGNKHTKPPIILDSLMLTRERLVAYSKKKAKELDLRLEHLSSYLDWRCTSPHSPTLHKIASIIWLYLPRPSIEHYSVKFEDANDHKVLESEPNAPPVLVTSSPKGEVLVMVKIVKRTETMAFEDTVFLLILYSSNISHCKYIDSSIQMENGTHCTFWEIQSIERLTHIVMDRYSVIYFTDGDALYKIGKTSTNMYLDNYETIYTPEHDTTRIISLWRQSNDVYFSLQSYVNEENIDVWKLRPARNRGVSDILTDDPSSPRSPRSPRSTGSYSATSGSESETDSNVHCKKIRTFSLHYEERIWQLGSMRFDKKCLLSLGAAVIGQKPTLLQMGFHSRIKVLDLVPSPHVLWPKTLLDEIPHSIYQHKETKSWFCLVPVIDKKANDKLHWIQFKLNNKKKVIWQRLIAIPHDDIDGEWLYFDEVRDVLIGYKGLDIDQKQYIFKYLPDITKYLWIEPEPDSGIKVPTMHRAHSKPKKAKDKKNKKGVDQFSLSKKKKKKKIDHRSNIKPSYAATKKKVKMQEIEAVDEEEVMD